MDLEDHLLGALLVLICIVSLASFVLEAQHTRVGADLFTNARRIGKVAIDAAMAGLWRGRKESDTNDIAILEKQMVVAPPLTPLPLIRANTSAGKYITWASLSLFALWTITIYPVSVRLRRAMASPSPVLSVDLDIAGDGIRAGLYFPAALSLVTTIHGCFHGSGGGMKELGSAHLINLVSLIVNIVKDMMTRSIGSLSAEERLIATISIDIASNGARASLSDKTTLSSRYFVWIVMALRLLGVFCMIALLQTTGNSQKDDRSYELYWYGPMRPSDGATWPVWTALATRIISWTHDLVLVACKHTFAFNSGRKNSERTMIHSQYRLLPATSLPRHVECWPMIAGDVWVIEKIVTDLERGALSDWGQSAALVTALFVVLHWLYYYTKLVWTSTKSQVSWRDWSAMIHAVDRPLTQPNFWHVEGEDKPKSYWQDQLMEACNRSDPTLLTLAMEHLDKADVNFAGEGHHTPLSLCASKGNMGKVKTLKLIYHAASTFEYTQSAISCAAEMGESHVLDFLLARPETIPDECTTLNQDGNNPLVLACRAGQWRAAMVLLEQHHVISDCLVTHDGRSPLWSALTSPAPHSDCTAAL
ncbi:Putative ankyrin repeat-containing domain superfamily [Septoria linicola]|uniref:Ankyrin repeat-containing domain superfamily n=1 Tax=Septoria linicola TaxID=215465 RepID=A0A9Q9AXA0_9PEZI|nr:Putative ankyrin repeat-containing domain superfamily [Septoria linicola]